MLILEHIYTLYIYIYTPTYYISVDIYMCVCVYTYICIVYVHIGLAKIFIWNILQKNSNFLANPIYVCCTYSLTFPFVLALIRILKVYKCILRYLLRNFISAFF